MTRDSSLRQRGRRYSMATHGHSEQGGRHGNYVLQSGCGEIWGPAYAAEGTTIRLFPQFSPDNPETWDPYRFSAEANNFGDWIRRYPAVRSMGDPSVTFITHDPADEHAAPGAEEMTPGWILYRSIDLAVAKGQDRPGWAALLRGGRGRGAQLPKPSEIYLVQAAIMQYKGRAYNPPKGFGPDDKTIVFEMGPSAGLAMLGEFNKVRQGYQGPENDYEAMMEHGDPVSLQHGRFVHFYRLSDGNPLERNTAPRGWNATTQAERREEEQIGYGCVVMPDFRGIPPQLSDYEPLVRSKVRPWDEILWFPTVEEQAQLLADKFPPEVILYAFRDHPEWIPEVVRHRAVSRTQTAMGGAAVPPGPRGEGTPYEQGVTPPTGQGWGAPPTGQGWGAPPADPVASRPLQGSRPAASVATPASQSPAVMPQGAMTWGQQQQSPPATRDPAMPQGGIPGNIQGPGGAAVSPEAPPSQPSVTGPLPPMNPPVAMPPFSAGLTAPQTQAAAPAVPPRPAATPQPAPALPADGTQPPAGYNRAQLALQRARAAAGRT